MVVVGAVFVGCVASIVIACAAHAQAGRRPGPTRGRVAVVALGFPSRRGGAPHPLQRWRAGLTARTAEKLGASLVVFTGRGRPGSQSEAQVMANLADLQTATVLEEQSTDTWENVQNARPYVQSFEAVVLVSDPLHASRARQYWMKQEPVDDDRVFITTESTFWDHWWLKVPTALNASLHWATKRLRHR